MGDDPRRALRPRGVAIRAGSGGKAWRENGGLTPNPTRSPRARDAVDQKRIASQAGSGGGVFLRHGHRVPIALEHGSPVVHHFRKPDHHASVSIGVHTLGRPILAAYHHGMIVDDHTFIVDVVLAK